MQASPLQRHIGRFRRHSGWMLLSVAGQLVVRSRVPAATLRDAGDVAGNFLQTFGGMYGVIVAFAIYVVWQEHNETQVTIEREAVSLGELFRMLSWLTQWAERDATRNLLLDYAKLVPTINAPNAAATRADERSVLEQAFGAFLAYVPSRERDQRLYDKALDLFQQLNEAREHRHTIAGLRLPEALRWFVFIGGALTVSTLWFVHIDAEPLQAFFTAAMTWVVVAASAIVVDLDDPYVGDFVVNWQRFRELATRMEAMHCPALEAVTPPKLHAESA